MTDLTQEKLEELKGRYDKCVDDNGAVTLRLTLAPSVADPMALTIKLEEEQRAFLSLLTDLTPDLIAAAERDMEGQADTERLGFALLDMSAEDLEKLWYDVDNPKTIRIEIDKLMGKGEG